MSNARIEIEDFKLSNFEPGSISAWDFPARPLSPRPPSKSLRGDGIRLSLPPTPAWPTAPHLPARGSRCFPERFPDSGTRADIPCRISARGRAWRAGSADDHAEIGQAGLGAHGSELGIIDDDLVAGKLVGPGLDRGELGVQAGSRVLRSVTLLFCHGHIVMVRAADAAAERLFTATGTSGQHLNVHRDWLTAVLPQHAE